MTVAQFEIDVTNQDAYPAQPDVDLTKQEGVDMMPYEGWFVNEHPSVTIAVSFDGVTDALKLVPGTPGAGMRITKPPRKAWFRKVNTTFAPVPFIARATFSDGG